MPTFPDVYPLPGLPERVRVYEVGPRDGLQAEATLVDTATKIELIQRLVAAGLTAVEATSFVSPRWVPQLADAEEVLAALDLTAVDRRGQPIRHPVLVPNPRGLDRAMAAGAQEIAVFVSATERFAEENLGTSRAGALELAAQVAEQAQQAGIRLRGYVSMCFGDPWEGPVPTGQVAAVAAELADFGVATISLGDTIGVATPGHVVALLDAVEAAGVARDRLALHFHDTYGQALANVGAGLRAGVSEFDASAGGLGGCPFARSATGNLATEDLVWMLHGLGIETGVDLDALVQTSLWLAERLDRPSPSRVVAARAASAIPPG